MPRMTRAALKAQAQSEEYPPDSDQPSHIHKGQELHGNLIHEDTLEHEKGEAETWAPEEIDLAVRQALRDITDENYPKADLNVEVQSLSPVKHQDQEKDQQIPKSTRKTRGKAKGRTKKKTNTPTVVEPEEEQEPIGQEVEAAELLVEQRKVTDDHRDSTQNIQEDSIEVERSESPENIISVNEEISEPGPAIEEHLEAEHPIQHSISKTPKFNPTIHVSDEKQTVSAEDSFVQSIRSRSPSKFGLSATENSEESQTPTDSLRAFTPLRRTSSTKFEESFEALDSLEDNIEQLTAGFSIIPAEEMDSPDSPVKTKRHSVRIQASPSTPNVAAPKTPRTTSNRLQSILRAQDKENTPPATKTPLKSKTPLKPKTPMTKEATPLKARTPAVRLSSPLKNGGLSVKKCRTPATKSISETTSKKPKPTTSNTVTNPPSPTKAIRTATMTSGTTSKPQTVVKKPASSLQRKPSQRQPSAPLATTKPNPPSRKPTIPPQTTTVKSHNVSMSFSASPAKPDPKPTHQRRVTAGGALSTSKPGFIPSKSSKPPTTSTFSLPGEAIAEKLKAQKEAREEKMKQPKLTLAEQKAAKLKADREAREERVRLNQLKAKEAEEKEKDSKKVGRVLSVSQARAEAAERGRQASKEWADKMLKKKGVTVEKENVSSTTAVETTSRV